MTQDPQEFVELFSRTTELEAEIAAAALRNRGFDVQVVGGLLTGFRAEAPVRARVMVRRAELQAAKAAWEETRADSVDIDWSQVDVGEPEPRSGATGGQWSFSRRSLTVAVVMGFCAFAVVLVAFSAGLGAYAPAVAGLAIFFVFVAMVSLALGRSDGRR